MKRHLLAALLLTAAPALGAEGGHVVQQEIVGAARVARRVQVLTRQHDAKIIELMPASFKEAPSCRLVEGQGEVCDGEPVLVVGNRDDRMGGPVA